MVVQEPQDTGLEAAQRPATADGETETSAPQVIPHGPQGGPDLVAPGVLDGPGVGRRAERVQARTRQQRFGGGAAVRFEVLGGLVGRLVLVGGLVELGLFVVGHGGLQVGDGRRGACDHHGPDRAVPTPGVHERTKLGTG